MNRRVCPKGQIAPAHGCKCITCSNLRRKHTLTHKRKREILLEACIRVAEENHKLTMIESIRIMEVELDHMKRHLPKEQYSHPLTYKLASEKVQAFQNILQSVKANYFQ